MKWLEYVVAVTAGIAAAIPLAVNLAAYVKKAVQERNWGQLLRLVMKLMEEAERKFADGATRKEWVLAMVEASADSINYEMDMDTVDRLIDDLCAMSKVVNGPDGEAKTE